MAKHKGLTLSKIKTISESIDNIDNIKGEVQKWMSKEKVSYIVAYLNHTVLIGRYENNQFKFHNSNEFEEKYIQRIRIFNEQEELLLWRTTNGFKGRYRKDKGGGSDEGNQLDVVDACQVLWGTRSEVLSDGFTRIYEDRGTELIMPLPPQKIEDFLGTPLDNFEVNSWQMGSPENHKVFWGGSRVAIKTRNYIDYLPTNQATYVDSRFMGFEILD